MIKRMFFDIETSPNIGSFWNPGYKIQLSHNNIIKERAIICICWKWEGNKTVHSLEWDNWCDKKMLTKFVKELEKADEVIGHNGDKFDLKWIRTRCLLHGIDLSPTIRTHDTLKIARSKYRFNSNRLDYLGKFLGVGGKVDTGGFSLWQDIFMVGDLAKAFNYTPNMSPKKAMRKMVDYCKEDVALLERVWDKLAPFVKPKTNNSDYRICCPDCGSYKTHRNKKYNTAVGTPMVELRCKDCNKYFTMTEHIYWKSKQELILKGLNDERTKE